ncbi:MAG: NADH:flavin oxidoreductase/NADH oxidase [Chloroflexota bacterium]
MSMLHTPITIKGITLRNRITMSPMCQYSSKDGFANDWHLVHLGSRAAGGAGLIIMEATSVLPEGRISPDDMGIWSDEHIDYLKKITGFIHRHDSVAGIQLAHAGRKASCAAPWNGGIQLDLASGGWQTYGPSPVPFLEGVRPPEALDDKGIEEVITAFRNASRRALEAGFKVIEIHAAHGYLLHEFMSPLSNHRTDGYGGTFENRIRLLCRVIDSVKTIWPQENPLFVRISSTDWTEGGWTLEDSVRLAGVLIEKGVDLIDCSSGGNVFHAKVPVGPGYQVPFSEAIKKTGMLTGAVGMITTASQAESILADGKADIILMGRQLLRDPYFAMHSARELGDDITVPKQYLRMREIKS